MLSGEVQKRLERAKAGETTYRPNEKIGAQLRKKTLVMFVGPVAAGKSFLMNHTVEADAAFARVPIFTTREPRADDEPGMFRYVPHDDEHVGALLDKIEAGEVVQYVVHPTNGHIYGSEPGDFTKEFNLLPTLSGVVSHLRQLPFKNTIVIGLATQPEIWLQRLHERYPQPSDEKIRRLKEAALSLNWLLRDGNVCWIDNTPDNPHAAVQTIINSVKYEKQGSAQAAEFARQMYERVQQEVSS